jgi:UDP-2,3-diacylglucosamine pyrophosphatase LpxH
MSASGNEQLESQYMRPYERLKAYVVSDVHLNNHPYDPAEPENPRRKNFRVFLTQVNETLRPTDKVQLVLNGDILDITGSWFEDVMPWDRDDEEVGHILASLLVSIMENNLATFDEFRRLLRHPNAEIIYIYGNHDGLLQRFPASHEVIRNFLSPHPSEQARVHFVEFFASEALDLYVAHGHLLDPFNHTDSRTQPALGDVVNLLIVNRFVERVLERMKAQGYSESLIRKLHHSLHDIEYLRPLSLVPVWIQNTAHQYHSHPENIGKGKAIDAIMIESVSEILRDPQMVRLMTRRLRFPKGVWELLVSVTLRIPAILPMISFVASKVVRRGHSNKYQYKAAQRLHNEQGYRLIAFGHTHVPGVLPLSQSAYYFNTGSWKPVINLFKYSKDPVELEYLNPDVQFNKVERCGILRIEKTDFSGQTPAEFALQTIQSGLS